MESEFERQQALAGKQFASRQTLEQSIANRDQANASVLSAQAALDGAVANVGVLQAQKKEAARTLEELKTALAKAVRDLSFTEIRAPVDGVIGNRAAQVGDFMQTGQRIAALVPLSDVFIDANFKETQLARLQPGQPVSITVDALPDEKIDGIVASVSPAAGSVFSLLPPDNATGNFTKIIQRLGVRIRVRRVAECARGTGMSVILQSAPSQCGRPTVAAHRDRNEAEARRERTRHHRSRPHRSPDDRLHSMCFGMLLAFSTSDRRRRGWRFRQASRRRATKFRGCRPPI
jgi:membrane fusion protein (multidrug efflux system)